MSDQTKVSCNDKGGGIHLRIIQVNDVYKLDNFASFKTLVDFYTTASEHVTKADKTIVVLAGDFLAPSLLSSLDRGRGIVDVMSSCGVTHVCLGNHECDIPFEALPDRIDESSFVWLNSNMRELDDKLGVSTEPYDVLTIESEDGKRAKKVALLGLLTDDPALYRQGSFGDEYAIEPVVDCTAKLLHELRDDMDLIIPMTHQAMTLDRDYATKFTGSVFPLVIGGHDHDPYDETVSGCRIIKTGMDATNTAIIDIQWPSSSHGASGEEKPNITIQTVPTTSFPPDEQLQRKVDSHNQIVHELDKAKLFRISTWTCDNGGNDASTCFSTSKNRVEPSNGSRILITIVRRGMNADCAIMNAGSIRGGKVYPKHVNWFTFSDLKEEMPFPAFVTTISLPGRTLSDAIAYSRRGAYQDPPVEAGGYIQTCDKIEFNDETRSITRIMGKEFDPDQTYLTVVPIDILNGIDNNVPILDWMSATGYDVPEDAGLPVKVVIVQYFVASIWLQLGSFADIDTDCNGIITEDEIRSRSEKVFGKELCQMICKDVMAVADLNSDGHIDLGEMLATQFVAQDMMFGTCRIDGYSASQDEVLSRLAADALRKASSHEDVQKAVMEVKKRLDKDQNGSVDYNEIMNVLGDLTSKGLLGKSAP